MFTVTRENTKKLFLLIAILVFAGINLTHFFSGTEDDAYISFRYLDNWISGQGLVFNPGEYVEGYTNFLWIVVLVPFRLVGISPEWASYTLSIVSLLILLSLVFRVTYQLTEDKVTAWSAVLLLASSATVFRWVSSGMETLFVATVLAYANWQVIRDRQHTYQSCLTFGVAVLIRPDALLFGFSALFASFVFPAYRQSNSWRFLFKAAPLMLALPLLHGLARYGYYGEWLPNTFYAKLTGLVPGLVTQGITYLKLYLMSGGLFLVIPILALPFIAKGRDWRVFTIGAQVVSFSIYAVMIGGDYLAYHRFLVPLIPLLCILSAISLKEIAQQLNLNDIAIIVFAFIVSIGQNWFGLHSLEYQAYKEIVSRGQERIQVAAWLKKTLPQNSLIAVNAAGVIPYITGMKTIDMLGLNDHHIARVSAVGRNEGASFVGHYKYDGDYVCAKHPDVIVISGGALNRGRSEKEVIAQAVSNTFSSDRAFLQSEKCAGKYKILADKIEDGKYVVVYVKGGDDNGTLEPQEAASAESWFNWGLSLLGKARIREAQKAFQVAMDKEPDNPNIINNLAYSYLDTRQYEKAIELFQQTLTVRPHYYDALFGLALAYEQSGDHRSALELWNRYINEAPESPWMDRAKTHRRLLSGEN